MDQDEGTKNGSTGDTRPAASVVLDEKSTVIDLLKILGNLKLGSAAVVLGCVGGLVALEGKLVHAEDQVSLLDLQGKLFESQATTRDVKADLKVAQSLTAELRDLNEQKVCANWTLKQRTLAVSRLLTAVSATMQELNGYGLDPKDGNSVPVYLFQFYGLDSLDPNLFEDDEETINATHELSRAISKLNVLINRMTNSDIVPTSGMADKIKAAKQIYEDTRRYGQQVATKLLAHLDDRYKLASTK